MRKIINPKQAKLFDSFDHILTEKTRKSLLDGWAGVFRHVILELMPIDVIGGHFDSTMGRPTKELYSIAGLLLIKEFKSMTKDEAVNAYHFHMDVQYALNLEPIANDLCERTLERYINLFEEDGLAKIIMDNITTDLIGLLGIEINKQRLDSTHIFSNMASFGRTRLMGVAIKRFFTQVIRSSKDDYNALKESLRKRYAPGVNQLFADTKKDSESRKLLRQEVAEDMHFVIQHFGNNEKHNGKETYKALERIFYEQCEVREDKVSIKKNTGGNVMQNPSDTDATYDGHKGSGYQVQLSETCNTENDVQLITSAIAQTAVESDSNAVEKVLEDLKSNDLVPDEIVADTAYTGDENVQLAAEQGIELIGPVAGCSTQDDDQLNVDDFNIDEETEKVICCPAGHKPVSSEHNNETGKTKTVMAEYDCGQCEFCEQCPVKKARDGYQLDHTAKERRLASRRKEQATEVFEERYKIRGGIEGTNSCLKRKTSLGQLRVRGRPAVFHAIYFKVAGWNILRASACAKMRKIVYARANLASLWLNSMFLATANLIESLFMSMRVLVLHISGNSRNFIAIHSSNSLAE